MYTTLGQGQGLKLNPTCPPGFELVQGGKLDLRQALEKNKHTQKCESGSFRPIFGVGHFGLGRWVVSAHFRGESFWPWVVSAKVYTDKQGTGGRAFGLVTVFSHKFLHLKLSNKSI